MDRWIISDTHFFHRNIIEYENRPFRNIQEMNKEIITKWNNKVKKDDLIFHLGDVYLGGSREEIKNILESLNGRKILILGNHDRSGYNYFRKSGLFETVSKWPVIIDKFIILSHQPLYLEQNSPYVNFYGHVHGDTRYKTISENSICVCPERWNYTPQKIEYLKSEILGLRKKLSISSPLA